MLNRATSERKAPRMKIVMWVHVPSYRAGILDRIQDTPGIDLVILDSADQVPGALADADGFISAGASLYTPAVEQAIRAAPKLRWFQSVSAGNDNLEALGIRDGIAVTGSEGHSGPVVAEHAIALLLAIAHAIPDWERAKAAKVWKMPRTGSYKSLYGGVAVVIGLGHIGGEIATRLKGLGMTVIGVTRSGSDAAGVDEAVRIAELDGALARADAVLVAAPLTAETRGLIDTASLAATKAGAYLVNIARGGLVDQPALIAALRSGHLGGAAIDVAEPEPLPPTDPLWDAPNLILVPHVGGSGSTASPRRLGETVKRNLDDFIAGRQFRALLPYGRP